MTSPAHARIRGIEHIGITVPDHDAAVSFFRKAFGAELLLSQTRTNGGPISAEEVGAKNGLRAGTRMMKVSILRLKNGPNVEIFEIDLPQGTPVDNVANYGISHFSVTVEDIDAMSEAFARAGGTLLEGPYDLGAPEDGPGNRGRFGRTPWGLLIEFEQFPAPISYAAEATSTRWLPETVRETEDSE